MESARGMPLGGVLAGMGGVGKTQLAADYARTAWDKNELDVLVWVTAASRNAVESGYAQAATELLAADPSDPQVAAKGFLAWLAPVPGRPRCRWLVVLDDVSDPADLNRLWPPASPHGRTLVTTRRKDAALTGNGRHLIEVGLFTPAEAAAYLADALAAHGCQEPDELAALARDLGCLPLALSQAAAYLIDAGLDCAAYRALLADRTTALADVAPDALPDDQTCTVAAAWELSLDRANTLRPIGLARPMLQLTAFLDPNGIPATVLTSPPALAHLANHRPPPASPGPHPTSPPPVTPQEARGALRALHRLSLIEHTPGTPHQTVRVHQLIQRATRNTLSLDQHNRLARTAADALYQAWPEIERDTALAQALRANTTALTTCADNAMHGADGIHEVLLRAGRSLGRAGQAKAAANHFQSLADVAQDRFGPDHPDTLTTRDNLARWRGVAGDAAGAAEALASLLEDMLRVSGPDHPHTLATRNALAHWRGVAGDAASAAEALTALLTDRERVLGTDHPDTLTTRYYLAHWRGVGGDAAGAAEAFAGLLADLERVLGTDHPYTLATRNSLARWRGEAAVQESPALANAANAPGLPQPAQPAE